MTRNQVFSNLESKYETWLSGLKQNGFAAANHYVANLKAIGEPITPHTANTAKWNGLFELLTGTRPVKGVFEISGVAEFARVYGAAVSFFTAEKGEKEQIRPLYPNCNCFDDLFAFVYQNGNATTLGDGGHTRNGFVKYCQFLCELESSVQDDMAVQQQIIGEPLQRITYGAPGTGKSFGTEDIAKKYGCECFRTTFHPDSDYSTFVGAYKPTTDGEKIVYDFRPQAFMNAYVAAWRELSNNVLTDNVKKPYSGLNEVMVNVVNAFIAEGGKGVVKSNQEIIDKAMELSGGKYSDRSFVPAFYCYNRVNEVQPQTRPALFEHLENGKYRCLGPDDVTYDGDILWKEKDSGVEKIVGKCTAGERKLFAKPVVLVIEEINRGNCAQIFGDLFQLLDRGDHGYSTYPIDADTDLATWLKSDEKDENNQLLRFGSAGLGLARPTDLTFKMKQSDWDAVMTGKKLALPPNLYIWATMNTSDQSLFPIDSAFKRRWDWKYMPIREGKYKDGPKKGQRMGWTIKFTVPAYQENGQQIPAKDYTYDWWKFLLCINKRIFKTTESEDKKLGYFFVKPDGEDATTNDGTISADRFVSKVIFYLWNDVFKDYGIEEIFKNEDIGKKGDDEKGQGVAFEDFFVEDGDKAEPKVLVAFFKAVGLEPETASGE